MGVICRHETPPGKGTSVTSSGTSDCRSTASAPARPAPTAASRTGGPRSELAAPHSAGVALTGGSPETRDRQSRSSAGHAYTKVLLQTPKTATGLAGCLVPAALWEVTIQKRVGEEHRPQGTGRALSPRARPRTTPMPGRLSSTCSRYLDAPGPGACAVRDVRASAR